MKHLNNFDDNDLYADIYYKLYDELSSSKLEEKYEIIHEVDPSQGIGLVVPIDRNNSKNKNKTHRSRTKKIRQQDHKIIFSIKTYLDDILKSYNYDKTKILEQYKLDFPRTSILINEIPTQRPEQIFNIMRDRIDRGVVINNHAYDLETMLALFCCQSSFCFQFTFLTNLYADFEKGIILTSLDSHSVKFYHIGNFLNIEMGIVLVARDTKEPAKILNKISNILSIEIDLSSRDSFQEFGVLRWKEIK